MYQVSLHHLFVKEDFNSKDLPPDLRDDFLKVYKVDLARNPYPGFSKIRKHELLNKPLAGYYAVDITWTTRWKDKIFKQEYRIVYGIDENNKMVEIISFDHHDSAYDKAKERTRGTRLFKKRDL